MKRRKFPEIELQKGLGLYVAALILTVPLPWLASAWTAATVHELCHLTALRLMGHSVDGIRIGIYGARITTDPLPPLHEFVCALAGPFGALQLLLLAKQIPVVCLFAVVQSLFNLLPIYPMDGGRALRSALCLLGLGNTVFAVSEILACALVLAAGIWASFQWKLGLLPIAASLCAVFPTVWEK